MREPYGITVFCDDIRYETSGKHIYVGVYYKSLNLVSKEPTALPALQCAIRLMIPADSEAKEVVFKILQDSDGREKVLVESPVISLTEQMSITKEKEKFVFCLSHLTISPLIIASNFLVKSRAYVDGNEVRLGVLSVEMGSAPVPLSSLGPPHVT